MLVLVGRRLRPHLAAQPRLGCVCLPHVVRTLCKTILTIWANVFGCCSNLFLVVSHLLELDVPLLKIDLWNFNINLKSLEVKVVYFKELYF